MTHTDNILQQKQQPRCKKKPREQCRLRNQDQYLCTAFHTIQIESALGNAHGQSLTHNYRTDKPYAENISTELKIDQIHGQLSGRALLMMDSFSNTKIIFFHCIMLV